MSAHIFYSFHQSTYILKSVFFFLLNSFQIKTNKADIDTLKNSGPSQDVINQLNQLNTRVTAVESKVQTIEQVKSQFIGLRYLVLPLYYVSSFKSIVC